MNTLLKGLREADNYTFTENGAVTYKSSLDALIDLFGMGAAYRSRAEADCIFLFKKAFDEDETLAMKCLFYLRDRAEGQGERRFFRVVCRWLANNKSDSIARNMQYIPEYGRYDDWYCFVGTKLEKQMFELMRQQLVLDIQSYKTGNKEGISLLAKWLKSENTSSAESRKLGNLTRIAFNMNHKEYRKTLSKLRERINVLERLMSAGKWDEIEFDKIPSRAGILYRNAFARHDIERMKSEKEVRSYEDFMKDETTKVNAKVLYPYEVVAQAYNLTNNCNSWYAPDIIDNVNSIQRAAINKYWDNLTDYFNEATLDALCVVDTSGSMWGQQSSAPINVAISLGLYAAEKARGPFAGHYISFSSRPQLIKTDGIDFVDKVYRIYKTNLCDDTNIEATFDLILDTAIKNHCSQNDLPKKIVVISDMEFNAAQGYYGSGSTTLMEDIKAKWENTGYKMPELIFWNVSARHDNVPMKVENGVTLVSGFSPVTFQMIMENKSGKDLVLDKLNSERYAVIK